MSKSYRVHIHDHSDQERWLAQADFTRRPTGTTIAGAFPVLGQPGRYTVHINVVRDGEEHRLQSYLTGEYVKDPASPTDAELSAAIERGLADGTLIDAEDWMAGQLANATMIDATDGTVHPAAETEIIRKDVGGVGEYPAWLVRRNGQLFVISHTGYMGEPTTQAFRATEGGQVRDWDEVAGGRDMTREQVLAELTQRPVDETGHVLSPSDVADLDDAAEEARYQASQAARHINDPERRAPEGTEYGHCGADSPHRPHGNMGRWCTGVTLDEYSCCEQCEGTE